MVFRKPPAMPGMTPRRVNPPTNAAEAFRGPLEALREAGAGKRGAIDVEAAIPQLGGAPHPHAVRWRVDEYGREYDPETGALVGAQAVSPTARSQALTMLRRLGEEGLVRFTGRAPLGEGTVRIMTDAERQALVEELQREAAKRAEMEKANEMVEITVTDAVGNTTAYHVKRSESEEMKERIKAAKKAELEAVVAELRRELAGDAA